MSYTAPDFVDDVSSYLAEEGYRVHGGTLDRDGNIEPQAEPSDNCDVFWFTWQATGMADCEVGENCPSELRAWMDALMHRLDNSHIEVEGSAA